jgi:dihydroorotate dehydrogenase electron transfer subunit
MIASARGQYLTTVVRNTVLCREHFLLTLRCADFPASEPGQFVQIACVDPSQEGVPDVELDWTPGDPRSVEGFELASRSAVLRRPFSLAGRRETADGIEIDIIGREVGIGTCWMSSLRPGNQVSVIGPLGNAFTLPAAGGMAIMVGGGVGIPPMIYLAEKLAQHARATGIEPPRAIAFCGAMSLDLLALSVDRSVPAKDLDRGEPQLNITQFAQHQIPAVITTDDGSYGFKGFVTQALEKYLDSTLASPAERQRAVIYTCGPEGMMKAVANLALSRNIACQVCVERAMACGMGTCQSCVIKVKKDDPAVPPLAGKDWCYRLACTDGPIFRAEKLLW